MRSFVKYQAIYAKRKKYAVSYMCSFFGVSRSGYYGWLKRRILPDQATALSRLIQECQHKAKQTYGYRRIVLWLKREYGLQVNHKAVLRLMRKYGLLAVIRRPRPLYLRKQKMNVYANRVNRDFSAVQPNLKWVTDISYIKTMQ